MVTRHVAAVERCFKVLDLLASSDRPLSIPVIANTLGLPRTSVHELVATMVASSYLEPVASSPGAFRLGLRLFEMGGHYLRQLDLVAEAQAAASELSALTGETCHVAVLDGRDVVYIAKVDSHHTVRMVSAVGTRLPAHCTGVGKALLAALPEEELRRRYHMAAVLEQMTPNSHGSAESLYADLEKVRATGISYDNCESNLDIRCVAGAVLGTGGEPVAGLSTSVPTSRWTEECYERYSQLVREATAQLSKRLGYRSAAEAVPA